jgi:alpha-galactosidase
MPNKKIVIIGAGSATFGQGAIADILACKELREFDLTISLVDINEKALARMHKLAKRLKQHFKSPAVIEAHTDRTRALPQADYVIISVARDRWDMWEKDFYIPAAYGFRHVFGENGGPGGAFHTLRSLHLTMPICQDIERLCPETLVLNYTNPESRVCLAISRLTKIKAVGLCHGPFATRQAIAKVLGRNESELDLTIAGINHFHWALKIAETGTGKDLKPEFDGKMKENPDRFDPLTRKLYDLYGYLTYPAPSHTGEYISWGHDVAGPVFLKWGIGKVSRCPSDTANDLNYTTDGHPGRASYDLWSKDQAKQITTAAESSAPLADEFTEPTGELAVPIICDLEFNRKQKELGVNIPNTGQAIENLPEDAIIEISATVDSQGIHPIPVGNLPEALAGLCGTQISVQNLLVEAYSQRSKHLLLQALSIDPVVDRLDRAREMMEHMLWAQVDHLPEFT